MNFVEGTKAWNKGFVDVDNEEFDKVKSDWRKVYWDITKFVINTTRT